MAFNVSVVNSCKLISVRGNRYDATSTQADVIFVNVSTNGSYTAIMNYDASTGKGSINVPTTSLDASNGVWRVCIYEQGLEQACKPLMIKCDLDCCLTKLTNELIECDCDCDRCSKALAKAQKIFLLLQSAQAAIERAGISKTDTGYYEDILSKYLKAREICDNSCGCDC